MKKRMSIRAQIIWILSLGLVVMGGIVWITYPRRLPEEVGPFQFAHCPTCKRESIYSNLEQYTICKVCGERLVPTVKSIRETGRAHNPYTKMFLCIYAELVAIMGLVVFVTRPRDKIVDENYFHLRCERCKQKIRFTDTQVGGKAKCPRCKLPVVLIPDESIVSESVGSSIQDEDRF
jgi:predicted amidophosphoribosyltransferase